MNKCKFSNTSWIRKDSPAFSALISGLKTDPRSAVANFVNTLAAAHTEFEAGLSPQADMTKLLQQYQDRTGIISTRGFTLPDDPSDPNSPDGSFSTDLIEGIVGAISTEIGVGITLYNLILDFVALLNVKVHVRGILMNNGPEDVDEINFQFPWGEPNVLPLSRSLAAPKSVMNPVDRKNYDCVALTFFGGVGYQAMQGFGIILQAETKRHSFQVYCQYFTMGAKGVGPGPQTDLHWFFWQPESTFGVLVDQGELNSLWFQLVDPTYRPDFRPDR